MNEREYEWVILSYYIEKGNVDAISILSRQWFSGLSRSVYDIVGRSRGKLSREYVIECARDELSADDVVTIEEKLAPTNMAEEDVIKLLHAVSYKFSSRQIRSSVHRAAYKIDDGEPPLKVKNELLLELSSAYEISDKKSVADHVQRLRNGLPQYIRINDPRLASVGIGRIHMGNLITFGGESGGTKTTTVTEFLRFCLEANPDLHAIYFSKEQPGAEIAQKYIAKETPDAYTYTEILEKFNVSNPIFCDECLAHLSTAEYVSRLQIISPTEFSTPQDIADIVRSYSVEKKKVIWAVDYLTLLAFPGNDTQTVNIAEGLKILKLVAQQTGSIGILISQLVKGWNVDGRTRKMELRFPRRSDLLWSSELINLSAYIIMLARIKYPRPASADYEETDYVAWVIDKLRFSASDSIAIWKMDFDNQRALPPTPTQQAEAVDYIKRFYDN